MKSILAICFASAYGLAIRYLFLFFVNFTEVISLSLVFVAPFAIGYVTVALSGLEKVENSLSAFFRPWAVTAILLLLTIFLSLEGAICWVIIYPFFSVAAGIGGLIAYYFMRHRKQQAENAENPDILDDFDRPGRLKMSPFLLLPFVLGLVEDDRFLSPAVHEVTREITVAAPAEHVWKVLTAIDTIRAEDDHSFFREVLDLPRHLRTELDTLAPGGRRTAYYERGLYFEETIAECVPGRLLRLRIKSNPGSIPPHVLDEHVVIGGKHFKALEDTYRLTPLPGGRCRVQLTGRVEINTPFNWYACRWANWLMSDAFDNLLQIVQKRATVR